MGKIVLLFIERGCAVCDEASAIVKKLAAEHGIPVRLVSPGAAARVAFGVEGHPTLTLCEKTGSFARPLGRNLTQITEKNVHNLLMTAESRAFI